MLRQEFWRVRATVSVISGPLGPQAGPGLLISTCHQAGFISHCPHDRGSCKGYLTPSGQLSVLASKPLTSPVSMLVSVCVWGGRRWGRTGWGREVRRAKPGQGLLFSGESWELTCPWPPSVQWTKLTGDSCTLWWNGRFPQRKKSGAPLKKNGVSSSDVLIRYRLMIRSWGGGLEKLESEKKILGSFLMCLPFDSASVRCYVNDSSSVRVEASVQHVDVW